MQKTPEQLRAEAAKLRAKAAWHIARAGSGGSWHSAEAYTRMAEKLEEQATLAV